VKLSVREKWIMAIAGVLVLAYAGVTYLLDPFLVSQEAVQEEIQQKRLELDELMMLVSQRSRYQRKLESLRVRVSAAESMLLEAGKVPVAAAKVQEVLHKFGQEAGVNIVRESVMRPKELDTVVEVPVELSLKGSLREIQQFLYQVESHNKLLTIPQLAIRSSMASNELLSVDLQIAGHMSKGRVL